MDPNLRDKTADLRGLRTSHVAACEGREPAAAWPLRKVDRPCSIAVIGCIHARRATGAATALGVAYPPSFAPGPRGGGCDQGPIVKSPSTGRRQVPSSVRQARQKAYGAVQGSLAGGSRAALPSACPSPPQPPPSSPAQQPHALRQLSAARPPGAGRHRRAISGHHRPPFFALVRSPRPSAQRA